MTNAIMNKLNVCQSMWFALKLAPTLHFNALLIIAPFCDMLSTFCDYVMQSQSSVNDLQSS